LKQASGSRVRDWMDMTPADWMDTTPADWLELSRDMPRGEWMETTPGEWMDMTPGEWLRMAYGEWLDAPPSAWMRAIYRPAMAAWQTGLWQTGEGWRRERHGRGCDCDDCRRARKYGRRHRWRVKEKCPRCAPDPCQCYCCIGDVDLAVYARLDETRVIPILVENERRREKDITLHISEWTTRGGQAAPVTTSSLEPPEFTLAPCEAREVVLEVQIQGHAVRTGEGTSETSAQGQRRERPDVDECLVAIADLGLTGCDHRPLRIAVAVLPRDCDPYTVACDCGCC
jgi:hypothetical protein